MLHLVSYIVYLLGRLVYTCVYVLVDVILELQLYFLEADISLSPELPNSARLACQKAPRLLPSLLLQIWDYKHVTVHSFPMDAQDLSSDPHTFSAKHFTH